MIGIVQQGAKVKVDALTPEHFQDGFARFGKQSWWATKLDRYGWVIGEGDLRYIQANLLKSFLTFEAFQKFIAQYADEVTPYKGYIRNTAQFDLDAEYEAARAHQEQLVKEAAGRLAIMEANRPADKAGSRAHLLAYNTRIEKARTALKFREFELDDFVRYEQQIEG